MSLMKFSTKYNVSRLTDADQPNSPVRLCNRNFCVLSTGCDLICASATENSMHRLCPRLHVVPLRKRPFWFLPSPMVATWLAWYNIPGNTRLWGQLRIAALSNLTASSVSKLCSIRYSSLIKDSLAHADRCCNVKTSNKTCSRWFPSGCAAVRGGA